MRSSGRMLQAEMSQDVVVCSQNTSAGPDSSRSLRSRCIPPNVAMMKASDPRQPDDIGICGRSILCPPAIWRVAKAGVHSFFVVVVDILSKESPQVLLVDDYHVIKELSLHRSKRIGILTGLFNSADK